MKKIVNYLVCMMLLVTSFVPVHAVNEETNENQTQEQVQENTNEEVEEVEEEEENPYGFSIKSDSGILLEKQSGKILYAKHEEKPQDPSSLMKLLGLDLSFNTLSQSEKLTMSNEAFQTYDHQRGVLWIQMNETLSVKDLEYATMLADANDTMAMLAEGVSGKEETFLNAMQKKAKEYGMEQTVVTNVFGISDGKQQSTCLDFSKLILKAEKNENFKKCFGTRKYEIDPTNLQVNQRVLLNNCPLLDKDNGAYYEACNGAKSGGDPDNGYAIVATAKKGALELVGVVMGSDELVDAAYDLQKLFNYGFDMYQTVTITAKDIGEKKVAIKKHKIHIQDVTFYTEDDFNILLSKEVDPAHFTHEIEVENAKALDGNEMEAEVVFKYGDKEMGRAKMKRKIKNTTPVFLQRLFASEMPITDALSLLVLVLFFFIFLIKLFQPPEN